MQKREAPHVGFTKGGTERKLCWFCSGTQKSKLNRRHKGFFLEIQPSLLLLITVVMMISIREGLFIQMPRTWVNGVELVPNWMSTALLVKELVLVPHFSLERLSLSRIRNHQLMSFLMNAFLRSSNAFQGAEKGAHVLVSQSTAYASDQYSQG